jgi:hypothetical protein
MACQFVERVERLYAKGRVVVEKMTLCNQQEHHAFCQFTLQTDEDTWTGQGMNPCEALAELETRLNILPPADCDGCER